MPPWPPPATLRAELQSLKLRPVRFPDPFHAHGSSRNNRVLRRIFLCGVTVSEVVARPILFMVKMSGRVLLPLKLV